MPIEILNHKFVKESFQMSRHYHPSRNLIIFESQIKFMKKLLLFSVLFIAITANAQDADAIKPAAKGVVYGTTVIESDDVIPVSDLESKMTNGGYQGKVSGKVTEVCKTMGCWIKIEKADGTALMVKSKEHGFFMPQDLVGRNVVIEGTASVKEVSEDKRKHFAEDAGKSKEEIKKIKGSVKEVQFVASGVKVVD